MKKILLACLLLLIMVSAPQALEATARVVNVGYTSAWFVMDYASADTGMWKTVLFTGKTIATIARIDSITGTHTDPDTIKKAVGTFENGTTYYWYLELTDSSASTHTTIRWPVSVNNYGTFTTDDFTQNLTITTGYSTAQIIHDSVGYYVAPLDSIILQYGKVSGTYTVAETITTVTHPDTFALTGLDEGVTFYCRVKAWQADSLGTKIDTSAEFSFTTTDLQYAVTQLRSNIDSLIIKVDTVNADLAVDSLILQWGAGLRGITAVADTITSVTEPDTFIIVGLVEGGTYYYRLLAFLPDSSAIETTSVGTYTRAHNSFIEQASNFDWPSTCKLYTWDFNQSSDAFSTNILPITTPWLRFHVAIDGEDDAATYDSIEVFLWSWEFGDSTAIDTLVALDVDTTTITPLKFRMYPGDLTDSSMTYYPEFDWGTFYSVSATMTDSSGNAFADSVLGVRSVHVVIEEIK